MKRILAVAVLAFPFGAHAQSSTTCSIVGNVTNCQHQGGSAAPLDYGAILRQGASIVPNYQEQELKRQQIEALRLQNEAARAAARREQAQTNREFVAPSAPDNGLPAADIRTGNGLLAACTNEDSVLAAGHCQGFLIATIQSSDLRREYFCPPPQSNLGQTKDIVVRYLRLHPEDRHESSSILSIAALAQAWPCGQKK